MCMDRLLLAWGVLKLHCKTGQAQELNSRFRLPAGDGAVREGHELLEACVQQCARHGEAAGENVVLAQEEDGQRCVLLLEAVAGPQALKCAALPACLGVSWGTHRKQRVTQPYAHRNLDRLMRKAVHEQH